MTKLELQSLTSFGVNSYQDAIELLEQLQISDRFLLIATKRQASRGIVDLARLWEVVCFSELLSGSIDSIAVSYDLHHGTAEPVSFKEKRFVQANQKLVEAPKVLKLKN